jgi:AbrB family looped-hinge helix DNA binding protein
MSAATITSKGQVTIPKGIRDQLNLHPGDRLDFLIEPDGTVRIVPLTTSIRELKGMVPAPERALSLVEMNEAIVNGVLKR